MTRYYCSKRRGWRKTPCIHGECRAMNYEPEIIRDVRSMYNEIMEKKNG